MRSIYIVATIVILFCASVLWLRFDSRCGSEIVELDVGSGVWIVAPCIVTKFELYIDGGSYGGFLKDANDQEVAFSWDGSMRIEREGNSDPEPPRLIYIDADYPGLDGAIPIPVGSKGEAEMINLLTDWIDSEIPPNEQDEIYNIFFDYSKRVEERKRLLPDLSESQKRATRVLRVIRFLNDQRLALGYSG